MPAKSESALKWPVYRPRNWGKPATQRQLPKPWFGLDTERDSKTGEFVCGKIAGETQGSFKTMEDLESGTYWVWNLPYDIEGMLRDLKKEEAWAAKEDGAEFPILGGLARYYHGKKFTLKLPGKKLTFIEANSFFNKCPLSKIGAKIGIDAKTMSLDKYQNDKESFLCRLSDKRVMTYQEAVNWYCTQDAQIVYNAIIDLQAGVRALGVQLGATPGATARGFLNRLGQFPDVLWRTHYHFLKSYCGGRFEVVKRGIFDEPIYQYDLVSAYPWALSNCPWLSDRAFHRWTGRFSDEALYGTYRVEFEFDNYLGIAPVWRDGIRVYSKGEKDVWLSRPEVSWLLGKGVDVRVKQSLEVFDEASTNLWEQIISELFAMKSNAPDEATRRGAKVILNSQYGVLIQLVRRGGEWVPMNKAKNPVDFAGLLALEEPPKEFEGGKYYAPLYASNLTALTRVRLLDAALAVGKDAYIGGHTDSVLSRKPLPDKFLSKTLGGWSLEKVSKEDNHICKTGMYAMGNVVKLRGITRNGKPELLWSGELERNSRCGIKSAKTWSEVSLIRPKQVANNFTIEKKRKWNGELSKNVLQERNWIDSEALCYVQKRR